LKTRSARLIVPVAAFAFAFALAFFQLHDDDAGFHVATGRLVRQAWSTGAPIPTTNPFSYADVGAPWVQHQELPAAAIAWLVDDAPRRLGLPSDPGLPNAAVLFTVNAALVGLLFALLAATGYAAGLRGTALLLLAVVAAAAACARFYERPLLASALLLAVTSLGLARYREDARRRWLWLAAGATLVNGHLHAGVVDALLLWLAVVAGEGLEALRQRSHPAPLRSAAHPARLLGVFALTLALLAGSLAAFAPSGLDVLLLPARFSTDPWWNEHLLEFRPLWQAFDKLPWATGYLAAAALLGLATWRHLRPSELLVLAGFGALALKHQRMLLPFVIASFPVVAQALARVRERVIARSSPAFRLVLPGLALLLAAMTASGAWIEQAGRFRMGLGPSSQRGIDPRAHPFGLLDDLARYHLPGEVFVSDGFAGTFLWRFFPERRVLVHNVIEAYRPGTYRDRYMAVRYAEPGFEAQLAGLGVRSFLLKHTSAGERALQAGRPNLRDVLFARSGTGVFPDAVLVDFDDTGALWVLRDALPAGVPTFDGQGLNPDTGALGPTSAPGARLDALRAHALTHPGCARCRFLVEKASKSL